MHALNNYPSPVYQVLNANQSAFLERILPTLRIMIGTMEPMEAANLVVTWGPKIAPTASVVY